VFNSQVHRNLWLVLAAAAALTAAACSKTATDEGSNTAKQASKAKPAVAAKPAAAEAKAAEPAAMITLPKGTAISAAARQTLATDKNKVGDTFAASLTEPIQVDGKTVIPKGAQVTCRIVKVKKARNQGHARFGGNPREILPTGQQFHRGTEEPAQNRCQGCS